METFQEIIDEIMDYMRDPRLLQTGVSAQGTLALSGVPGSGESFTLGQHTFTFKASRTAEKEVALGSGAATTAVNIASAINTDCDYFTAATGTSGRVIISAVPDGSRIRPSDVAAGWNRISFTEAASNLTADGSGYFGSTRTGVYGSRIEKTVNQVMRSIAHGVWIDPQTGRLHKFLLPALETTGSVVTTSSASSVALPVNFNKHLFRVYSATRNINIKIYNSVDLLLHQYGYIDGQGAIEGVAVKNNTLLAYQRLGAETLNLWYYKKPTTMVYSDDIPDCLPEHLAMRLLLHGSCYQLFSRKEQGTDGQKINTKYHLDEFNKALGELAMYIGPPKNVPVEFPDEMLLDAGMTWGF